MRILDKAISIAQKISEANTSVRYRLGCVIVRKNRILSVGWNRSKTHPKSKTKYHTVHAEFDAIHRCGESLRGASLFVCRSTPGGKLALSRPCSTCMEVIKYAGITTIYYTDIDGNWVRECL